MITTQEPVNDPTRLSPSLSELAELAHRIRVHTVQMTHRAGSSHVGTSLSMAEILAVLYGSVLRIRPQTITSPDRDRFILSKGHGCRFICGSGRTGLFSPGLAREFLPGRHRLAGHATAGTIPGIEVSTGSLGHGLPIACGMALAGRIDKRPYRVFALLSDGECDEGSNWEAALFAAHHQLDNLIVIVDYNKIQSLGHVKDVLGLEPFGAKWAAFGWSVREIDGHNLEQIGQTLAQLPWHANKPNCVIAHTIKGKGISFMEDKLLWHYRTPQNEEYLAALGELGVEA